MFLRSRFILILFALLLGCKIPSQGKILSPAKSTKVPLNIVIHVQYNQLLDEGVLRSKNRAQLTTCALSEESPLSEDQNSKTEVNGSETKKTKPEVTETQTSIPGLLYWKKGVIPSSKDTTKKTPVTNLYFIPYPSEENNAPLEENSRYCFTVSNLLTETKEEVLGVSTSFTTEEYGTFSFRDEDTENEEGELAQKGNVFTNLKNKETIPIQQRIIFGSEYPLHPLRLAKGIEISRNYEPASSSTQKTTVSKREDEKEKAEDKEQDTENPPVMGSYTTNETEKHTLELVESLQPDKAGNVTAQFSTYAIKPFLLPSREYKLEINLMNGKSTPLIHEIFSTMEGTPENHAQQALDFLETRFDQKPKALHFIRIRY